MSILVTQKAPDFTVPAVFGNGEIGEFNLYKAIKGKYALVFFYPLDFTFVCPTELIALEHRMDKFRELGVEVIAVSIDSQFTHNAYRNTAVHDGGIGPVSYTLASDVAHTICQSYGIQHPAGVAFRAAFIIDKNCDVRVQFVNDLPIGRDIDEIIRVITALQHVDVNGEACPAGWRQGRSGMETSPKGVAAYLSAHSDAL